MSDFMERKADPPSPSSSGAKGLSRSLLYPIALITSLISFLLSLLLILQTLPVAAGYYNAKASAALFALAADATSIEGLQLKSLVTEQIFSQVELSDIASGTIVQTTGTPPADDTLSWLRFFDSSWTSVVSVPVNGISRLTGQKLELRGHLSASRFLSEVVELTSPAILLSILALIALAALAGNHMSRRFYKQIDILSAALKRVTPGQDKGTKVKIQTGQISPHSEMGQLVKVINGLLQRCDITLQEERTKSAAAATREKFIDLVLETLSDGIILLDSMHKIIRINRAGCTLFGRFEGEMIGREIDGFIDMVDRSILRTRLSRLNNSNTGDQILTCDIHALLPKQESLHLSASVTQIQAESGQTVYMLLLRDNRESRGTQDRIRLNEERLKLAVKATRSGVWDMDVAASTFWWSPEFMAMLGYGDNEIPPSLDAKYTLIHPEDLEWVKTSHTRYLAREIEEYTPEYRMLRKDGSWMWIEDRGTAEWNDQGEPLRFSGIMADCTERKRFEKQLMYMATHDPLTELPNRTLLQDRVEHALMNNNSSGLHVGLLLLDIDRFKLINDSLGHEIGDQLVKAVSLRLQQTIRPSDTLARLSGDEFVVICEDLPSPQEAARLAKRLLSAMSQDYNVDGNHLNISMSIGISMSPADGTSSQALLRHADTAMHNAKSSGGNCYRFFTAEMNKEAVQRLSLERHLGDAIERQQFILHYQPKVDILTREIVGAEALIRWPHMALGNLSPMQFIPIAEETGQILAIGEWVIRETLSQICIWRERGLKLVPIAINLSGKQLMTPGIDEMILRLLREFDVDPSLIELEITESSVMSRMDKVLPPLLRLREAGVSIALDDFGTGYSSLAYLRQLPITALKIDRSFVKEVPSKPETYPLISIIVEIGRHLGLKVVAEGVETEEQREFLKKQMDTIICQGWLFYKALPVTKFEKLLKPQSEES